MESLKQFLSFYFDPIFAVPSSPTPSASFCKNLLCYIRAGFTLIVWAAEYFTDLHPPESRTLLIKRRSSEMTRIRCADLVRAAAGGTLQPPLPFVTCCLIEQGERGGTKMEFCDCHSVRCMSVFMDDKPVSFAAHKERAKSMWRQEEDAVDLINMYNTPALFLTLSPPPSLSMCAYTYA